MSLTLCLPSRAFRRRRHISAQILALAPLLAYASICAGQAAPGTVDLLATPPEITSSVSPNLMISFDDSGSMGRNYMPDRRPFDNNGWGADDSQNFNGSADYNSGRPWLCAGVIDPRVTDPSDIRSRPMNGVYYNPNTTYEPPYKTDGVTTFPDASFTAAWDNGIRRNWPTNGANSVTTRDLGSGSRICGNSAGYYQLKSNVTLNVDASGNVTNTGTLYNTNSWEWVALPTSQRQNYANWYSYYHFRSLAARSAFSRAVAPFDENIRVAWQNFNSNRLGSGTDIFKFVDLPETNNVRTRFYDWLYTHPVSGGTPNQATTQRAGDFFTRNNGARDENPYWDRDLNRELSCRQNFHLNITDGLWNGGTIDTATDDNAPSTQTLPDGRTYSASDNQSKIMWNEPNAINNRTMADLAWHYWRTDLRPDFAANVASRLKVPPFIPDRSTNLFGIPLGAGQDSRDNKEIYWNPANDPATWPHLVQFFISFGADGTIPRNDDNYQRLRAGTLQWSAPSAGTDDGRKIDDVWHAAINSRGKFFSTTNPEDLIVALNEIIASIIARRGASTAVSVSLPIITDGTTGYTAGYDTSDWSGFVTRVDLDPQTGERQGIRWDAGCLLTGGACASTAQTGLPVRNPNSRVIVTSDGIPGSGRPFRYYNLSDRQKDRLNVDPSTIRLDLGTWTADAFGPQRVDYIRGKRTNESTASPRFRARSSVLGAVIRGQPVYISSPTSGYDDSFPSGSPEFVAAEAGFSYARFQNDYDSRSPTVYVAANDGMLHAFDASHGKELFAYIPNAVIENFRLTKSTQVESGFTPSVDDKPIAGDAFINGRWRTIILGSMRLGARGVYAIDVTNAASDLATEDSEKLKPMWEFTNVPPPGSSSSDCAQGSRHCSSLGYTYESVNFSRIKYQNKWVAFVSSGYFPKDALDPASRDAAASRTSLLVIDLATGALIREIRTSSAPQSPAATFGLSQPIVYDLGNDQTADVVMAGDLAGNLWRFDVSGDTPSDWKVDLMFRTYGNGGAALPGDQPISSGAVAMADPLTRGPIWVFGTGKFLGLPDRSAAIPQQAFYGIRDYGTCESGNTTACARYPIQVNQLVDQNLAQDSEGVRRVTTANAIPEATGTTGKRGWRIRLNLSAEPGERAFTIPFAFFSSNAVLLRSIIPKGVDPCDPGARYGLMVVRGSDGTAFVDINDPSPSRTVGGVLSTSTPPGDPVTIRGGGGLIIPGVPPPGSGGAAGAAANSVLDAILNGPGPGNANPPWHRGAWRQQLQDY